ncbi:hypothetical protein [Myroides sp. DW712]|uniref:hypothetical protein n=1 Tax=Myroides sp. DW712 TaxID=3389800 RepID=UPI00397C857E
MEVLYIVIALHAENKQAFTAELCALFPFAFLDFVEDKEEPLLLLSMGIDEICWTNFNGSVFFLEENIALFSRKHPYLKIGVLNKIGQMQTCFYEGYIMKNRQIIFEYAGLQQGYQPLLKQLLKQYDEAQASIFATLFSSV